MKIRLVSAEAARALDLEAAASWGLSPSALVEAAGRNCAGVFAESYPGLFSSGPLPRVLVLAGGGNNGADALVMLRALILGARAAAPASLVLVSRPEEGGEGGSPRKDAFRSLSKMGVPCRTWEGGDIPGDWDLIIDGIAGTGISGPLRGAAADMVQALNRLRDKPGARPLALSIDLPSGNFDRWEPGMPLARADATLGIEPLKSCLFNPAARSSAGTILPVGGIFPPGLVEPFTGAELLDWPAAAARIPPVRADDYKHRRGIVEIHAGSPGSAGAARIAGRGAQAAGAGIVRLMADREIYPILASPAGGIMVAPFDGAPGGDERFRADALLLGPGWGRAPDRRKTLEWALEREASGTPLILDADAIHLAKEGRFHGNAVLTPHPGEFSAWTGIPREGISGDPGPLLQKTAREKGAVILYKSSVLIIAGPDGRLGYLDGLLPALAAGGSGDLLAGFAAAIAARTAAAGAFDGYACACAAAALLLESVRRGGLDKKFIEPLELAEKAAGIAGAAWL